MRHVTRVFGLLVVSLICTADAVAQTGGAGLRGYVRDEQGAVLPGVTVTAASPEAIAPHTSVTDAEGYFRIVNVPPGTYTVTAELSGFAVFKRDGVLLRAGNTFQLDITMTIGTLPETVTVTGESPMLEVARPGNVMNIDGEFQKQLPPPQYVE